jgi:hypothetical protein
MSSKKDMSLLVKIIILALALFLAWFVSSIIFQSDSFGQTKYDSPYYTIVDTVSYIATVRHDNKRVVRDFYFNPANSSTSTYSYNYGIADLNIETQCYSSEDNADTIRVDIYGLKKIAHKKTQGHTSDTVVTYAVDSTYVGTVPVSTTLSFKHFALDLIMSTYYQYDGIRVVYKTGGFDPDSCHVWSQIRNYRPSVEQ